MFLTACLPESRRNNITFACNRTVTRLYALILAQVLKMRGVGVQERFASRFGLDEVSNVVTCMTKDMDAEVKRV